MNSIQDKKDCPQCGGSGRTINKGLYYSIFVIIEIITPLLLINFFIGNTSFFVFLLFLVIGLLWQFVFFKCSYCKGRGIIEVQNQQSSQSAQNQVKYCSNCGKQVIIGSNFCKECGTKIN